MGVSPQLTRSPPEGRGFSLCQFGTSAASCFTGVCHPKGGSYVASTGV